MTSALGLTFYTRAGEWLSKAANPQNSRAAKREASADAVIAFGLLPFALFNWGFWTHVNFENAQYLPLIISVYIAALWIILAPMLIVKWEQKYREFVDRVSGLCRNYDERHNWHSISKLWRPTGVVCGVVFAAITLVLHELSRPYLTAVISIPSWSGIYFTTIVVLLAASYATGIGIAGVLHTIRMYHALIDIDLAWEPFHQDQRGGYAFLTDFALRTTAIFFGGITVVPAALSIGAYLGGGGQIMIFVLVVGYGLLIAMIFFWPMTMVLGKAQRKRQELLGHLSPVLDDAVNSIILAAPNSATVPNAKKAQLDDMERKISHVDKILLLYEKISLVKVIPFSGAAVAQVIGYSILPIIIASAQLVVSLYSEMWK